VSDKAKFSDSKEKFVIEIDTSKLTNTLIQMRVDALTKALWQYKLSPAHKRMIKDSVKDLVRKFAGGEIPEPQGSVEVDSKVNIIVNASPSPEEQSNIELLTKELDVTKRRLRLCEEENDILKKENKKVKEYEDKLNLTFSKLKLIEEKINLYKKGVVTDPKQIINLIDKILSQA
jgi:hypothetical protein